MKWNSILQKVSQALGREIKPSEKIQDCVLELSEELIECKSRLEVYEGKKQIH